MKSKLLYIAAFLVFMSISFTFNGNEVSWLWENKIQVPIVLISMAVILMVVHFYQRMKESLSKASINEKNPNKYTF